MSVFEILWYQKEKISVSSTLYGETKRNPPKKTSFSVFSSCFGPKPQNAYKATYTGKQKDITIDMYYEYF